MHRFKRCVLDYIAMTMLTVEIATTTSSSSTVYLLHEVFHDVHAAQDDDANITRVAVAIKKQENAMTHP